MVYDVFLWSQIWKLIGLDVRRWILVVNNYSDLSANSNGWFIFSCFFCVEILTCHVLNSYKYFKELVVTKAKFKSQNIFPKNGIKKKFTTRIAEELLASFPLILIHTFRICYVGFFYIYIFHFFKNILSL